MIAMSAPEVRYLEFDSSFWGISMFHATQAVQPGVPADFVQVLADVADLAIPLPVGFQPVDVRVTFDQPLRRRPPVSVEEIRFYEETDLPHLVRIARESHRITRFYADPGFPDERCDDLYETWVRNSVDGWADQVIVADQRGYVTVHLAGGTASIGLIAVDRHARGQGLGQRLVHAAVRWAHTAGAQRMEVVTQGRNIPAQRLFQRCGFRTSKTEVWLHKWYR